MTVIKCKINTIKLLYAKTVIFANMYTYICMYAVYIYVTYIATLLASNIETLSCFFQITLNLFGFASKYMQQTV